MKIRKLSLPTKFIAYEKLKIYLTFIIYIVISSLDFIRRSGVVDVKSLSFFLLDKETLKRLHRSIVSDYDTNLIFITRLFHNKPFAYLETFFISVFRSVDISFLFSLAADSSMYEDVGKIKMLYPLELPIFILAVFYFIRRWATFKKRYFFVFSALLFSLLIIGAFLPAINTWKLFPLVVVLRTIFFISFVEFLKDRKWREKV